MKTGGKPKVIQQIPPMGWNTWNTFGPEINEELVCKTADYIISSGLADSGYKYVIIDDGWSEPERDKNGRLVANENTDKAPITFIQKD